MLNFAARTTSNFSAAEVSSALRGERARTLTEAGRVQAAVESMRSLLQLMEQPSLEGPGGAEYSLPATLHARARRAVAGNTKMQGNTYGWATDEDGTQTYTLISSQTRKTVQVSASGDVTYIEEQIATRFPALSLGRRTLQPA